MEMIAKYLRQFLVHNDLAYIPGLGIFEASNQKAEINPTKREMAPPIRTVSFKQQSSKDNSFIDFLARIEGKSAEAAKKDLASWVDGLKKTIVSDKKVNIEGLGELGLNSAKKVAFKPIPDLNISPDTLGMKPVKIETVAQQKQKEAAPIPVVSSEKTETKVDKPVEKKIEKPIEKTPPKTTVAKEKEKRKNPLVLVFVIIFILILLSAGGYYFLKMQKDEKPPVVEKIEKPVEPVVEPEPQPEPTPEPKPEPVVTISERTGRYFVIGNSFEIEENAYKYREDVMSRGMSKSKIILPDNRIRLYRVSLDEFDDLQSAITKMEDLRSEFGNTIWVLTY